MRQARVTPSSCWADNNIPAIRNTLRWHLNFNRNYRGKTMTRHGKYPDSSDFIILACVKIINIADLVDRCTGLLWCLPWRSIEIYFEPFAGQCICDEIRKSAAYSTAMLNKNNSCRRIAHKRRCENYKRFGFSFQHFIVRMNGLFKLITIQMFEIYLEMKENKKLFPKIENIFDKHEDHISLRYAEHAAVASYCGQWTRTVYEKFTRETWDLFWPFEPASLLYIRVFVLSYRVMGHTLAATKKKQKTITEPTMRLTDCLNASTRKARSR